MEKKRFVPLSQEEHMEIREALESLGWNVWKAWEATLENVSFRRWAVKWKGQCVGIYDLNRHTFVD